MKKNLKQILIIISIIFIGIPFCIGIFLGLIDGFSTSTNNSNTNNVSNVNIQNSNINQGTNTEISNSTEQSNTLITFLKGTNGKELFEILCNIGKTEKIDGLNMGDSIIYSSANTNYGIELETNTLNEINYIRIYTLLSDKNEYQNFFNAIKNLKYDNFDTESYTNWLNENLGKEAITKIGDINLKLYNGTSGTPILEVFTDGNETFQKEQIEKLSN